MPSLYRRGRVYWVQFRRGGRVIRRSLRTRDKPLAEQLIREVHSAMIAQVKARLLADLGLTDARNDGPGWGTTREPEPASTKPLPTLSEAWTAYQEWARVNVRPTTLERVRNSWRLFQQHAGKRRLDAITVAEVERFKAALLRDYKPKSVAGALGDIRAVFNRLGKLGMFTGPNPAANVRPPRIPKRPPRFLSHEQVDAVMGAARTHSRDMALFFGLCLFAGLRKGEAVAARWEWVDWQARTLTIQAGHGFMPKDTDCRTIPISERLVEVLEAYRQPQGYVLAPANEPGKDRYRLEVRYAGFPAVVGRAGVPWATPHVLRHTFASLLVQSGVSLFKVQSWLGHADSATTQVYAHLRAYDADVNGGGGR